MPALQLLEESARREALLGVIPARRSPRCISAAERSEESDTAADISVGLRSCTPWGAVCALPTCVSVGSATAADLFPGVCFRFGVEPRALSPETASDFLFLVDMAL